MSDFRQIIYNTKLRILKIMTFSHFYTKAHKLRIISKIIVYQYHHSLTQNIYEGYN